MTLVRMPSSECIPGMNDEHKEQVPMLELVPQELIGRPEDREMACAEVSASILTTYPR